MISIVFYLTCNIYLNYLKIHVLGILSIYYHENYFEINLLSEIWLMSFVDKSKSIDPNIGGFETQGLKKKF